MDTRRQDVVREKPVLTQAAFNRLLEWLDDRGDSQGERYVEMRQRLVWYFDRRNRRAAEDLADETLNRIGRTLEKDGTIGVTPRARYCYAVARFVLLEDLRHEHKQAYLRDDLRARDTVIRAAALELEESLEIRERRLECLERCLQELKPDQRALVLEYYRDANRQKIERRRDMAKRLGITMSALATRLSRIRAALEMSVEGYLKARRRSDPTSVPDGRNPIVAAHVVGTGDSRSIRAREPPAAHRYAAQPSSHGVVLPPLAAPLRTSDDRARPSSHR